MNPNETLVEKTITTANVDRTNGGQLNVQQQTRFVTLLRRYATLLPMVRFIRMTRPSMDIDKMHIGEPITVGASEDTPATDSIAPKFNKITLTATKVRTDWAITTEMLQTNLEQDGFEGTFMRMVGERMAHDLEDLAILGDTTTYASDNTPAGKLRRVMNGWDLLTDSAHIIDVGGGNISKAVFAAMLRQMPKEFKNDPGMRWFMGNDIAIDWIDTLSDRATGVGDAALSGSTVAPFGKPVVEVPIIPDNKVVTGLTGATAAYLLGNEYGPFELSAASNLDRLTINVNSLGVVTVTLIADDTGHTTLDAVEVAKKINDALAADGSYGSAYANVARVTSDSRLLLVSPTYGSASTIVIDDPDSPTYTTTLLGFEGNLSATGAASGGTSIDGSWMWLLNPQNLIWAILDGTRIFTEFNRDRDRIEATIFNFVALQIENLSSIVKAINIRKKPI
jgi:hypothetical protein